jgi:hypothetical protein
MSQQTGNLRSSAAANTSEFVIEALSEPAGNKEKLRLRIVRGPLKPDESESISSQYNQLTGANIPKWEFLHWVQDSPEGPAWHVVLETSSEGIVGHTCLIPFRARCNGRSLVPAKSEYSFIREEFRASKIQGFESSGQLKNLLYIDQLFRHCRSEGWGPLFISTSRTFHRAFRSIACYPVDIPVRECLLVLRPWRAALQTPNLRTWQRAALGLAGLPQRTAWSSILPFAVGRGATRCVQMGDGVRAKAEASLSFFGDSDSLRWRYLQDQYECLAPDEKGHDYLILKSGSPNRYLRICQWHLTAGRPISPLIKSLVEMAMKQRALGVRWSVYGDKEGARKLAQALKSFGFLCARRLRTILVNSGQPEFLVHENWGLSDAMFCFDP